MSMINTQSQHRWAAVMSIVGGGMIMFTVSVLAIAAGPEAPIADFSKPILLVSPETEPAGIVDDSAHPGMQGPAPTVVGAPVRVGTQLKNIAPASAAASLGEPRFHIQGDFGQEHSKVQFHGASPFLVKAPANPETLPPIPDAPLPNAPGDSVRQWQGISNSGWIPPDTIGAVGPGHVVEAVNSGFAIYTKLGTELQGYTTFSSFLDTPVGWYGSMFDPRVVYDGLRGKFVMLVLGVDDVNSESYYWIAVSKTSNPLDGWCTFLYSATDTSGSSTAWLDYVGVATDGNGVAVSGNYFYFSGGFRGSYTAVLKPGIFDADCAGDADGWKWVDLDWPSGGQVFSQQPAQAHTSNANGETYFVNTFSYSGNKVLLVKVSGHPAAAPSITLHEIGINAYDGIGSNIDQPGSSIDIDGGDTRVMNAVYANRRVFFSLTDDVNNNGDAAGWLTVKLNSDTNTNEWQDLIWSSGGHYYFYPAVTLQGADSNGNLAVFGSWTGSDSPFVSGLYKIYDNQPAATTGPLQTMVTGQASYVNLDSSNRNRWGDYSGAGYDWTCGNAWGWVGWADTGNRWATEIGARKFATEGPCPQIEVTVPNGGEVWISGTTRNITWKQADLPGSDDVYLFFDDGTTTSQIAGPLPVGDSSFSWTVPEQPTTQGKISAGSLDGAEYTASDWSDANFTVIGPPSNDNFVDRIALTGSTTTTGANIEATGETGEPSHAGVSVPLASVWWSWEAPGDGQLTISTEGSGFDTTLAAYTGSSLGSLSAVASNDDFTGLQSQITFPVSTGTNYAIAVDGYSSAEGVIEVAVNFEASLALVSAYHPPNGKTDIVYYWEGLRVTGGQPPYTFSLIDGTSLPFGLTLQNAPWDPAIGTIWGQPINPTAMTGHDFTVQVMDANSDTATTSLNIRVIYNTGCSYCHAK